MSKIHALALLTGVFLTITTIPYIAYLMLYHLLRPEGSPADKSPAEPKVSIILPTYNEERIIEKKLDDVFALDYPMEKVELVIVDSSDDNTRDIIRKYFEDRDDPSLNLITENERRGLAPALNEAYAAAENEMVVKTDCDSYLAPNVLREAAANLADTDVAAVTGQNSEILGGSEVESGYRDVQARIQTLESHLDSTLIFHGPFSAFQKDAIVPIDSNSLADDTELALKVRRNGKRVIFDPTIHYMEASHSDFRKRRKQKDRRGMGLIRLLIQHYDALGDYGKYGRIVLPFNWWFMIVSPVLLAVTIILGTVVALLTFGIGGVVAPSALIAFVWLGQQDLLGPLQSVYSIFDTQVSLLHAAFKLSVGESDGTWEVDAELRDVFK